MKALLVIIVIYILVPFALAWLASLAVKANRAAGFVAGAILLVAPLTWIFGHTSEEWYGGAWLPILFFFLPLMIISIIGLGTMIAAVFKREAVAGYGLEVESVGVPLTPREPESGSPKAEKDLPAVAAMRERLEALARDAALLHRAMAQAHRDAVAYAERSTPHELEWLAIAAAAVEQNAREAAIETPQRSAILAVQYQRLVDRAREIGVVV
jgi:hypothetical protein